MLKYKGYIGGRIEYDDELKLFHGRVIGLKSVITFQGSTPEEIEQAFKDSVEDYLEMCREAGEKPEKTYSGNIPLRVDPELHASLTRKAAMHGLSLNSFITEQLKKCA
jgi:predicted HicB family RNase H-like nuclease